jgi:glycosyltransferase involved in cell wall biosynthesis
MIVVCYSLKTWGGAEKNLVMLINSLTIEQNKKVILFSDRDAGTFFNNKNLEVVTLPLSLEWQNPASFFLAYLTVSKRIGKAKEGIQFYTFGPLFSFFGGLMHLRYGNVKLLTSERTSLKYKPVKFFVWCARLFYWSRSSVITTTTTLNYRFLHSKYPEKKVILVKNYYDNPAITSAQVERLIVDSKIKLIYTGRLVKQKCIDLIIEACYLLSNQDIKVDLHIYGIGPEEEMLKGLSQSLSNDNLNIIFCGFVKTKDIPYHDYSALFLPSKYEGMNNTIVESLTNGLPVITSVNHKHEIYFLNEGVNCLFTEGAADSVVKKILEYKDIKFDRIKIIKSFESSHKATGQYLHDISL